MNETPDPETEGRPQGLAELIRATSAISIDIARINDNTWAIYGDIPVDGDVILAEFGSYAEARTALDEVPTD